MEGATSASAHAVSTSARDAPRSSTLRSQTVESAKNTTSPQARPRLTDLRSEVLDLERVAVGDPKALERRLRVIEDLLVRGCDSLTVHTELNRVGVSACCGPEGAVGARTLALLASSALSSPTVAAEDASSSVTGKRFEGLAERGLMVTFIAAGCWELKGVAQLSTHATFLLTATSNSEAAMAGLHTTSTTLHHESITATCPCCLVQLDFARPPAGVTERAQARVRGVQPAVPPQEHRIQ